MNQSKTARLFIFLSVLTGFIGAFVNPLMSYFIVEGLNSPPVYIGFYTVSVTIAGLVISHWFGHLADHGTNIKKLYTYAILGTIGALLTFIVSDSFLWVWLAGLVFMSFGNASIAQMLTLGRVWAGGTSVNITKFNARVRAGMSLAWMIGPAIAFALVSAIGFSVSFSIALTFALAAIAFVWRGLPEVKPVEKKTGSEQEAGTPLSFWLLAIMVVLGMTSNLTYQSAIPLYTVKELNLPEYLPGVLMSLVAGLQIPVMLSVGRLSERFEKDKLMVIAFIFAIVFYLLSFFAQQTWQFIALQIVNALFYGLFAGLGITIMQQQLPNRIGFTSSLYSNAMKVGIMFGSSSTGLIAQFFSFRAAMLGAACASLLALICMLAFIKLKPQASSS